MTYKKSGSAAPELANHSPGQFSLCSSFHDVSTSVCCGEQKGKTLGFYLTAAILGCGRVAEPPSLPSCPPLPLVLHEMLPGRWDCPPCMGSAMGKPSQQAGSLPQWVLTSLLKKCRRLSVTAACSSADTPKHKGFNSEFIPTGWDYTEVKLCG